MKSTDAEKRADYPLLTLQSAYDEACTRAYWTKDPADEEKRDRLFYRLLAERKTFSSGAAV